MQQDFESLSEAVFGIYAADLYMNLPFLIRARRPRNCYFRLDTGAPGHGAVCVWKHSIEAVRPRLAKMLKSGIPVFGVTKYGTLVTSCSVGEALDSHWEVGNVYTQEDFRRQGYGRFVVSSAVNYILDNGRTPIYECDRENTPSTRTAESLDFLLKGTQFEGETVKE